MAHTNPSHHRLELVIDRLSAALLDNQFNTSKELWYQGHSSRFFLRKKTHRKKKLNFNPAHHILYFLNLFFSLLCYLWNIYKIRLLS